MYMHMYGMARNLSMRLIPLATPGLRIICPSFLCGTKKKSVEMFFPIQLATHCKNNIIEVPSYSYRESLIIGFRSNDCIVLALESGGSKGKHGALCAFAAAHERSRSRLMRLAPREIIFVFIENCFRFHFPISFPTFELFFFLFYQVPGENKLKKPRQSLHKHRDGC